MPNQELPEQSTAKESGEETMDRRNAAKKAGKFLTYTAPALIALITAKDANAAS